MKQFLLITSTIRPAADMPQLAITSAAMRLKQYCDAFQQLISSRQLEPFAEVFVAENSGYDFTEFRRIFASTPRLVHFIPLPQRSQAARYGRGFAEMNLIDDFMQSEFAAAHLSDGDMIWKITGRYSVLNLRSIVVRSVKETDLIINLRRYPKRWADMHVFAFNARAWSLLRLQIEKLKEDSQMTSAELAMYSIVKDLKRCSKIRVWVRLPIEPYIRGTRGSDGREYDAGKQRLKRWVRVVARHVVPWLHV